MAKSTYKNNTGVRVTKQNWAQVLENVTTLAALEVLVGFPEDTTQRDEDPGDDPEDRGITNAALAYIHDNGSPEVNIPARPFMVPAMEEVEPELEKILGGALKAAMRGEATRMEQAMIAAGLTAKLAIQKKINEGIPPPLSQRTLENRARRGKSSFIAKAARVELARRERGDAPTLTIAKPLIDTAQMRNAANFVIRSRKKRRT